MSGLNFGGKVPFVDARTGARVEVAVFGAFVGHGIDAHEQQAVREWILNALASSAAAYDGPLEDLPKAAGEWGAYVSQSLGPQLAQHFQAQGHLEIHGVHLPEGYGAQAKPMPQKSAPVGSGSLLEAAAAALAARMGAPLDQAREVAAIVLEVVAAHGGVAALAKDPHGKGAPDPYGKPAQANDPYGKDPYGKDAHAHDPYGKKPDWKK